MPRYNIEHNGKWACFTSVADGFITPFMDKESYEEWRKQEYGLRDYEPAENRNTMTLKKAVFAIRLNRDHEDALDCILESGLSKEECETLLYDAESERYCPKRIGNGQYECPNCGKKVKYLQSTCKDEYCALNFVWRT